MNRSQMVTSAHTHAMRRPGLTIALGTDCVVFDWLIGLERSS